MSEGLIINKLYEFCVIFFKLVFSISWYLDSLYLKNQSVTQCVWIPFWTLKINYFWKAKLLHPDQMYDIFAAVEIIGKIILPWVWPLASNSRFHPVCTNGLLQHSAQRSMKRKSRDLADSLMSVEEQANEQKNNIETTGSLSLLSDIVVWSFQYSLTK